MSALLKIVIVLATVFFSTFLLTRVTGIITAEGVIELLKGSQDAPWYVAGPHIVSLLFFDFFLAVPNLTIATFAGFAQGMLLGGLFVALGLLSVGITGYLVGRRFGANLLRRLAPDAMERDKMSGLFERHGFMMLCMCQATPMLPEITSSLAGMHRMSFSKFLVGYIIGTAPHAFIAAYLGSISSVSDPRPAAFGIIGISVVMALMWGIYLKRPATRSISTDLDHTGAPRIYPS